MKRHNQLLGILTGCVGMFLQLSARVSLASETQGESLSPLGPIAFLVEGTWEARLPSGTNGVQVTIQLRCSWTANHQGIRFDSEFVRGEKHSPYVSGLYGWNPAKKQIVFWNSDSEGSLHEGSVKSEAGVLVQDFTITERDGKISNARSRLTKHGPDIFTNEILLGKGSEWQKVAEVTYRRDLTAGR